MATQDDRALPDLTLCIWAPKARLRVKARATSAGLKLEASTTTPAGLLTNREQRCKDSWSPGPL